MTTLSGILWTLANTVTTWRDLAIAALAMLVIGCLWLYASLVDPS